MTKKVLITDYVWPSVAARNCLELMPPQPDPKWAPRFGPNRPNRLTSKTVGLPSTVAE